MQHDLPNGSVSQSTASTNPNHSRNSSIPNNSSSTTSKANSNLPRTQHLEDDWIDDDWVVDDLSATNLNNQINDTGKLLGNQATQSQNVIIDDDWIDEDTMFDDFDIPSSPPHVNDKIKNVGDGTTQANQNHPDKATSVSAAKTSSRRSSNPYVYLSEVLNSTQVGTIWVKGAATEVLPPFDYKRGTYSLDVRIEDGTSSAVGTLSNEVCCDIISHFGPYV
jgi:hypothetical protein